MNKYLHDEQGKIIQVFYGGDGCPSGVGVESDEFYSPDSAYIENGVVYPLPKSPGDHHVFDYSTKAWVDPRTPETQWPVVRRQRDTLLAQSDWTQLPDVPLETKETWATYRQALRDVTLQPDPFNVVWPVTPD